MIQAAPAAPEQQRISKLISGVMALNFGQRRYHREETASSPLLTID